MPHTYYRGCWHVISRGFRLVPSLYALNERISSSQSTEVYNPKAFILHAASLRQGFPHCARFLTAASRRSLARVSVPVWPIILSDRLSVVALVSHYLTNKLIGRELIPDRSSFQLLKMPSQLVSSIRRRFQRLSQSQGQIAHVLLTRSPLIHRASSASPFDLHVLSTPPAFILSQDQTLRKEMLLRSTGN